jgi:hypothetical protein
VAFGAALLLTLTPAAASGADRPEGQPDSLPSILRNQLAQQKQARQRVDQLVTSILDHGYEIAINAAETKVVLREKIAEIDVPVTTSVTPSILSELEETAKALGGEIRYPSGRSRTNSREFFVQISRDPDLSVYFHQRVGQLIFSLQVMMESGTVYPCSDRVKPASTNPIARDPTRFGFEVIVHTEPVAFIAHVETSADDASRIKSITGKIVEAPPIKFPESDSLNRAGASRIRCRF